MKKIVETNSSMKILIIILIILVVFFIILSITRVYLGLKKSGGGDVVTPSPTPSPNPSHDKIDLPENNYNHSNFIPNNFYFEIDEEKYSLEECKNDLIVFLSLLK